MSKKHWILVKRGLSQDPKHREAMGNAVWVYLHILDRADWETGIVYDWKDQAEADDMGINVRTLRKWRRELGDGGYITCNQEQYGQQIVIHNWVNPRNYSGEILNKKQGDMESVPKSDTQGYIQGDTQGSINHVTPTYNSRVINHDSLTESANKKVDAILEQERKHQEKKLEGKSWPHREKFPEAIRELLDVYVRVTGQHPTKDRVLDWLSEGQDWLDLGILPIDIEKAYQKSRGDEKGFGGFTVGRPGSLTNTANMYAGERRASKQKPTDKYERFFREIGAYSE